MIQKKSDCLGVGSMVYLGGAGLVLTHNCDQYVKHIPARMECGKRKSSHAEIFQ